MKRADLYGPIVKGLLHPTNRMLLVYQSTVPSLFIIHACNKHICGGGFSTTYVQTHVVGFYEPLIDTRPCIYQRFIPSLRRSHTLPDNPPNISPVRVRIADSCSPRTYFEPSYSHRVSAEEVPCSAMVLSNGLVIP